MKTILIVPLFATSLMASEYSGAQFSLDGLCASISKSFGTGYEMTRKNVPPEEYCAGVVSSNVRQNNLTCSTDDLIAGCVKHISVIQSKKQK